MSHRAKQSAWEQFVATCTAENVDQFLAETSEIDWLVHVNYFSLDAELEFIERNELNPALLATKFAYPLRALGDEDSGLIPLVEAYRNLFDDVSDRYSNYGDPEKMVHLVARQSIRKRLHLPPLTQTEIDAFYTHRSIHVPWPALSEHRHFRSASEVTHADLVRVCHFLQANYPDVVEYFVARSVEAERLGSCGSGSIGGPTAAQAILTTSIEHFIPLDRDGVCSRNVEILKLRASILKILTDGKVKDSFWSHLY